MNLYPTGFLLQGWCHLGRGRKGTRQYCVKIMGQFISDF